MGGSSGPPGGRRRSSRSTSSAIVVVSDDEKRNRRRRKVVLGMGYWVQGLRCFPWMAVNFYLKDTLHLDPSSLQILQNSSNLPMVAKPIFGLISDSFFISGQHRLPYLALAAILQAVSWFGIASLSPTRISFYKITLYLLLSNFGASIAEVANDAIVAETGKETSVSDSPKSESSSSGDLQSFVWIASSIGGVLGNLLAGVAIDLFSPQVMFLVFGVVLVVQFLVTICIHESSLNLPKSPSNVGIRMQLSELLLALHKPEITYPIIWFAASYAIIPALTGTMFFYQTQHLKIESSILGISKVFGQTTMLLWGVAYNRYLKSVPPRILISAIQATMAVFMISDALFVKGIYRMMGIPDSLYVVVFSGFLEVLYFFKILPFSVVMASLCPPGCEGSLMAFIMSAIALAFILSGFLGVALTSCVGVMEDNLSGLPFGLIVQAICTLLPLYWSSCIPVDLKPTTKSKGN